MPIIPTVGRRGWKLRLALIALYGAVIAGAATVMFPFLLMISLGFTSAVDFDDMRLIPKYIRDDGELYRKYVFEKWFQTITSDGSLKYNLQTLSDRYALPKSKEFLAPREVNGWYFEDDKGNKSTRAAFDGSDSRFRQRVTDFNEFRSGLQPNYYDICLRGQPSLPSQVDTAWGTSLEKRYGDVGTMCAVYGGAYVSFVSRGISGDVPGMVSDMALRPDWWAGGSADAKLRTGKLDQQILLRQLDWYAFKATVPAEWRQIVAGRFDYERELLKDVALVPEDDEAVQKNRLLKKFGLSCAAVRDIPLPAVLPANPAEAKVWTEFVRNHWSPRFVRVSGGSELFVQYLRKRYGTIEAVNKAWATNFTSFDSPGIFPSEFPMYFPAKQAELSREDTLSTPSVAKQFRLLAYEKLQPRFQRAVEWAFFVQNDLPIKYIRVIDPEELYREFLLKKYGSLQAVNLAQGTRFNLIGDVVPPYREVDFKEVYDHRRDLRFSYLTRNFVAVINFIALQGRAMWNTLILVLLTVGTNLTITPLAAYVLSRFRLPYTYKVLLFLIATMAFPGEVASMPSFLLMRKLHLFNTYWALVLPGLANGFGIFILKSFFDSLPEELFEAARIDGAGDLRQLWNVAIPLIKPILAINMLGSFTGAYGGFMWAFLVCRKESMWTLMVYLYQFEMSSHSPSLTMAALFISSLPILIMFICAQRVILRGIILPQFK